MPVTAGNCRGGVCEDMCGLVWDIVWAMWRLAWAFVGVDRAGVEPCGLLWDLMDPVGAGLRTSGLVWAPWALQGLPKILTLTRELKQCLKTQQSVIEQETKVPTLTPTGPAFEPESLKHRSDSR